MKRKVLLIGPAYGDDSSFYGGGLGGYTRNMALYLKEFQFDDIELKAFYSTVRKKKSINLISFPVRFLKDVFGLLFVFATKRIDAIHILAQYRFAIPREFVWVLLCKFFGKKIVYEIKAGQFINACENSKIHKMLANYIIKRSHLILCEGKPYISYLNSNFGKGSVYFPNVVSLSELPKIKPFEEKDVLKILFVGYCYEGKGVFELVKAINSEEIHFNIELDIIGAETTHFTTWMDSFHLRNNVKIKRYGVKTHDFVLEKMKENMIYCYPSRHPGEGHNNTINEAMMNCLIIISSKVGFLSDVVYDCGFLIEEGGNITHEIVKYLIHIKNNQREAFDLALAARSKIAAVFNSEALKQVLEQEYKQLLSIK